MFGATSPRAREAKFKSGDLVDVKVTIDTNSKKHTVGAIVTGVHVKKKSCFFFEGEKNICCFW